MEYGRNCSRVCLPMFNNLVEIVATLVCRYFEGRKLATMGTLMLWASSITALDARHLAGRWWCLYVKIEINCKRGVVGR